MPTTVPPLTPFLHSAGITWRPGENGHNTGGQCCHMPSRGQQCVTSKVPGSGVSRLGESLASTHSLCDLELNTQLLSLLFYTKQIIEKICKALVQPLAPTNHLVWKWTCGGPRGRSWHQYSKGQGQGWRAAGEWKRTRPWEGKEWNWSCNCGCVCLPGHPKASWNENPHTGILAERLVALSRFPARISSTAVLSKPKGDGLSFLSSIWVQLLTLLFIGCGTLWLWASSLTSLGFSFLICEVGVVIVPRSWNDLRIKWVSTCKDLRLAFGTQYVFIILATFISGVPHPPPPLSLPDLCTWPFHSTTEMVLTTEPQNTWSRNWQNWREKHVTKQY